MAVTIQGIRESVSDDGKRSWTIHYTEPFEDWESNGDGLCVGMKCGSEWTRTVDCGFLKVGDQCELFYAKGFKGLATLKDIKVVNPVNKPVKSGDK